MAGAAVILCLTLGSPVASAPAPPPLPSPLTLDAAPACAAEYYPRLRVAVETVTAASFGVDARGLDDS